MKKLNQIELYLDGSYTKEEGVEFIFGSRCICGYLEQKLVSDEFLTKLSRINIYCTKDQGKVSCKELEKTPFLATTIAHDLSDFFTADEKEKQNIYAEIILAGIEYSQEFMPVPIDICNKHLNQFKLDGYKHKWVHLEKEWEKFKIKCVFKCEVKMDAFYQTQEVFINDALIVKKIISKTKPREFIFFLSLGVAKLKNGNEIHYTVKNKTISIFNIDNQELSYPKDNI